MITYATSGLCYLTAKSTSVYPRQSVPVCSGSTTEEPRSLVAYAASANDAEEACRAGGSEGSEKARDH